MKTHYSQTLYRAFWFKVGVSAARFLGINGARRLARVIAELYRLTHPQAHAAVRENLALLCGPQLPESTVRRTFHNFGATLADYFQLGARSREEALALIETRRGFEHIQSALSGGKGALLVTVHTGLFELGGLLMEQFQLPLVVLSLPEPSPALNQWRAAYRQRWGAETLEVGGGEFSFVAITRELARGKCVAMLVDRPHRGDDAILVDFPHGQVPFSTGSGLAEFVDRSAPGADDHYGHRRWQICRRRPAPTFPAAQRPGSRAGRPGIHSQTCRLFS